MAQSRVVPSPKDFDEFSPPFTDGERELVEFFDDALPADWEIYARPHMNGEWPSVVLMHRKEGVAIYDVIHWESGQIRSVVETIEVGGVTYDEKKFVPVDSVRAEDDTTKWINPIKQVKRYRKSLLGFYVPGLGEEVDRKPRQLKESISVGIYCPNLTTKKAKDLLGGISSRCTVFGKNHLKPEALSNLVVPILRHKEEDEENQEFGIEKWADRIRFLLNPPFHSKEMGRPVSLSDKQKKYAHPSPEKHLRLKGTAGSGKTLVLAQRAARNAARGDRVLVVYYNITLGHYIRHYIDQAAYSFAWKNIDIVHFHGFCQRYLYENHLDWPTGSRQEDEDATEERLTKVLPGKVINAMKRGKNAKNRRYDVILIDEGQDFDELWFKALYQFLEEPGEVLLVADERQNIYDRHSGYGGMQFSGRFGSLESSYRMPSNLIREVNRFAEAFIEDPEGEYATGLVKKNTQQTEFPFNQPRLVWKNVSSEKKAQEGALAGIEYLTSVDEVHSEDIVVLVPRHKIGLDLSKTITQEGYRVNHVFGDDSGGGKSRKNKKAFMMNDGRLKLSTIHSFKGWELINVLLITPEDEESVPPGSNLDRLIYTAITRARNNLFVFNPNPKYDDYGEEWPSTWS
jgi:hypothetical protein